MKRAAVSFSGNDRLVSAYMESEFLERISRRHREFLSRTAVLERMSAPLCEAVLDIPGSGAVLADLAGSNLLLVPLDRRGEWYRYHHLFRDMLLAELERQEPDLIPALLRRAAAWCLLNDLHEEALDYFMAAGDVPGVAGLAEKLWLPTYWLGRCATVQRWLRWLDEQGGMERYPHGRRAGPRSYPPRWRGRPRPSDGLMRSIAGSTGMRPDLLTPPPRPGPPWSGLSCAGMEPSRCAPTRTRPYSGSRLSRLPGSGPRSFNGSRSRRPRCFKGSPECCAVTSTAVTRPGARGHARGGSRRARGAGGRAVRTVAGRDGERRLEPGGDFGRTGEGALCAGSEWQRATLRPWSARCSPAPRCTGET